MPPRRLGWVLSAAAVLAGCATVPRYEAASDIHAFLVAIRDGDQATFEAHLDRPALRNQLRARLIAEQAGRHGEASWQAIGATLAAPLAGALADRALQPDVLRAVAVRLGYDPARPIPGPLAITQALRRLDEERVCAVAKRDAPCVLIFKREEGVWKLVEFEGELGEPKG